MSQFKLEYHEKNNIGEEGIILTSLSLDICCLQDIRLKDEHMTVDLRFGNIFYNVHFNLCYMVVPKQNHQFHSFFEHFSFSLIEPKEEYTRFVDITDKHIYSGKFSFPTLQNTEGFLSFNQIASNCGSFVYIGNIFLDDFSAIAESIRISKTCNTFEDEEFLKKTEDACYLSQLLYGEKMSDLDAFKEAIAMLYEKSLGIILTCAEDKELYPLSKLARLCNGERNFKEELEKNSFHLSIKKDISIFNEGESERTVLCFISGYMDTIFVYPIKFSQQHHTLMLSFDRYGSVILYSFDKDRCYPLPRLADKDIMAVSKSSLKKVLKYPYVLFNKEIEEIYPDINNPDFIYYYSERMNTAVI